MIIEIFKAMAGALKEHAVEACSLVGGIFTFIIVRIPSSYDLELFLWKFFFGLVSAVIYAIVGWHIRRYLDDRKGRRNRK